MCGLRSVAAGSLAPAEFAGIRPTSRSTGGARIEWAQRGVRYPDGKALPHDDLPASLLLPRGRTGPHSSPTPTFAASPSGYVSDLLFDSRSGYLASRIAVAAQCAKPRRRGATCVHEIRIQQLVCRAGFNVGRSDGARQQSRTAVKAMHSIRPAGGSWPTADCGRDARRARPTTDD